MKIPIFILSCCLLTFHLSAQTIDRIQEESLFDFVTRVGPDSMELITEFTRETEWDGTPVIIAFFQKEVDEVRHPQQGKPWRHNVIHGFVFKPVSENSYKVAVIDNVIGTVSPEGSSPQIVAIFFANADTESVNELIILVQWEQHYDGVNGMNYETRFYQRPNVFNLQDLTYLQELSAKFDGCDCSFKDGKKGTAKFKTEEEVRAELVRMGFKQ